jgi:transcriptional regulator with XRE-family HTH domain
MPVGKSANGGTDGGKYQFDSELFRKFVEPLLDERGWNQQELADAAGLTQGTVSKYLSGEREPKASALMSIAVALGVPIDQLVRLEVVRKRHQRSETPVPSSNTRRATGRP